MKYLSLIQASVICSLFFATAITVAQDKNTEPTSKYEALNRDEVINRCDVWVKEQAPDKLEAWVHFAVEHPALPSTELIVNALGISNPKTQEFIAKVRSSAPAQLLVLIEAEELNVQDPWLATNFRLWFVTQLIQRNMLEEAMEQLSAIDNELVAEPAVLYFNRAVCAHQLLMIEEARESLTTLLTKCESIPNRYRMLGELMEQDVSRWEEKSLGEIARMMRDVERRLEIGRSGQKVQKVEQEIIESLDELIAKLEQQAGGGGGAGSGSQNNPNAPAQESRVKGSTAPGEVDEKDLGTQDGWGNLPPKDQAKAKQILGTLFPPHYQRAIEAYNRKAAQRGQQTP
ncbi:hypothetical protein [Rubinisphaera sp.]|uniref:hypothetical protein n=1 Tax=Rubinisphaera sp. TaxID=2024857 RepID=UPI000C0CCE8E|nr:hypothetical protein [Rubinisphaera sp.]MBV10145.1 hypothetical protein [Rubinisphaera sp.]HCS50974.1 hypothetical protein [Planctomycetaceae bacterium]|tara:strand:- start:956 stop:1987 length:1032 start_codon:yes stop_codon:yes gene_type:complete